MKGQKYLIFGGTGSLGSTLVKRLTALDTTIAVFSRDEAKHHKILLDYPNVISIVGDIRNYEAVRRAIRNFHPDTIIVAAAMKQVPACEDYPYEAVQTNVIGAQNVVGAVEELYAQSSQKIKILSISTDKACKPVNSYGMTKALQERIHLNGTHGIYNCVRYGNVLSSTGSVIPLFKKLIEKRKALTITDERMTRFLLSLDQAVDLIFTALQDEEGGKIFIPKVPAAKVTDLAKFFTPLTSTLPYVVTGIRPGEKIDEILISEEELSRTEDLGKIYVIHDIKSNKKFNHVKEEYSSKTDLMTYEELEKFLINHGEEPG